MGISAGVQAPMVGRPKNKDFFADSSVPDHERLNPYLNGERWVRVMELV